MAKADRVAAEQEQGGGNPPAEEVQTPTEADEDCEEKVTRVRLKPLTLAGHQKMAEYLKDTAQRLARMREMVVLCYAPSSELARSTREAIRGFNRMRSALNSRYFSEGHSKDGTTIYFTKDIPVLEVDDE